jgi:FixJ family two-component response regulator
MEMKPILIVDDEKNIRFTLSQALESLGTPVKTAINGEEALQKLEEAEFGIVLLDQMLPGISGLTVLRKIRDKWPKTRVILITAHGTIELAVEAMKLGAVDFLQKPFVPNEIRELVTQVRMREHLEQGDMSDYKTLIELTKRHIADGDLVAASDVARKAIAADPGHAEAYNFFGAIHEMEGKMLEAQKFYRAAFNIDPTYKPAWANLERSTSWRKQGGIDLGVKKLETEESEKDSGNDEESKI